MPHTCALTYFRQLRHSMSIKLAALYDAIDASELIVLAIRVIFVKRSCSSKQKQQQQQEQAAHQLSGWVEHMFTDKRRRRHIAEECVNKHVHTHTHTYTVVVCIASEGKVPERRNDRSLGRARASAQEGGHKMRFRVEYACIALSQ